MSRGAMMPRRPKFLGNGVIIFGTANVRCEWHHTSKHDRSEINRYLFIYLLATVAAQPVLCIQNVEYCDQVA